MNRRRFVETTAAGVLGGLTVLGGGAAMDELRGTTYDGRRRRGSSFSIVSGGGGGVTLTLVDDYEDGTVGTPANSNWTYTSKANDLESANPLSGSYSAMAEFGRVVSLERDSGQYAQDITEARFLFKTENTGIDYPYCGIGIGNGDPIFFSWDDTSAVTIEQGPTGSSGSWATLATLAGFSTGTVYTCTFTPDYANGNLTCSFDGSDSSDSATVNFTTNGDGIKEFTAEADQRIYLDDFKIKV
jgi:hypothetical protein